jgi:hypothetical protein
MTQSTVVIEYHLPRLHFLPPTDSFPDGLRLVPGENNVPTKYLDELEAQEIVLHRYTEVADSNGIVSVQKTFVGTRKPGVEALEALQQPVTMYHGQGHRYVGPQITIHRRPEPPEVAPKHPPKLPENLGAALEVVAHCDDSRYLERWALEAKGQLKTAIVERLKTVK